MSRRSKRRKVSKVDSEKEESSNKEFVFNLKTFQSEFVNCLPVRETCRLFMGSWALAVQSTWCQLSDEDKVKKINEGCKKRNYPLFKVMKKMSLPLLKGIYVEFISPNRKVKLTRSVVVSEIIAKFFGEESPLDKRENEKKNLDEIKDLDKMIRFIKMCEITIPNEMLENMFSFIPRNLKMIENVGGVCKHFYLTFLAKWPHIIVSRRNLHKIPLLVLRSIKSISFSSYGLLMSDYEYIWDKLSSERLREILISSRQTAKIFRTILRFYKSCEKNKNIDYTLRNVTELQLGSYESNSFIPEIMEEIFPNLRKIFPLHSSDFFIPCSSTVIDIGVHGLPNQKQNEEIFIYDKIEKLKLEVKFEDTVNQSQVVEKMQYFPNIKELQIIFIEVWRGWFGVINTDNISLSTFSTFGDNLKKIEIFDSSGVDSFSFTYDLKNPKIEELVLKSCDIRNSTLINLRNMIKQDFLSSKDHQIKKLKVYVPLISGKNRSWKSWKREPNSNEDVLSAAHVITSFLTKFVLEDMSTKYDNLDFTIVTLNGWNEEERFRIRYQKKIKRIIINYEMYLKFQPLKRIDGHYNFRMKPESMDNSDFKFLIIPEEEEELEKIKEIVREHLLSERVPGISLLCVFLSIILGVLEKKDDVRICDFEVGGSDLVKTKIKKFISRKAQENTSLKNFIFEESSLLFTSKRFFL